ncbi:hypothetical protein V1520DRAFT_278262 [Lipomyces starkeyi]|uniref:PHD-type domain-containing protein n=1 Tax=Lipomyces starkeyi NRRL Y-11557 TaxID=675824 RepID=A0A1E3PYS1_LIPST|nr:hypothetical protein LIPSTDRAFT_171303 [Lipomyces starkeyi NRRL Y-11557]
MSGPINPAQSLESTASSIQPTISSQPSSVPLTSSTQGSLSTVSQIPLKRGPYKRHKPGLKRKRGKNKKSDEESDEEFTFDGLETKSGRKVHKPQQFDPLAELDEKRTAYFRRDLQICKVCSRGHSPESNLIVFCDGCNDPYHQLCHDPPIGRAFIEVAEAQWFCYKCQSKLVERKLEVGLSGASLTEEEVSCSFKRRHRIEDVTVLLETNIPTLVAYTTFGGAALDVRTQTS